MGPGVADVATDAVDDGAVHRGGNAGFIRIDVAVEVYRCSGLGIVAVAWASTLLLWRQHCCHCSCHGIAAIAWGLGVATFALVSAWWL